MSDQCCPQQLNRPSQPAWAQHADQVGLSQTWQLNRCVHRAESQINMHTAAALKPGCGLLALGPRRAAPAPRRALAGERQDDALPIKTAASGNGPPGAGEQQCALR